MGFHFVAPGSVAPSEAWFAATLDGAQLLAKQVELDFVRDLGRLDFVVTGACAVDPRTGVQFGMDRGFFDIEWALLSELGVVDEKTPVLVCVHDCQVVELGLTPSSHDTAADWILTPTRTMRIAGRRRNPSGIRWELVDEARLAEIDPLRQLSSARAAIAGTRTADAGRPASSAAAEPPTATDAQRLVREKVWTSLRSVARPDSRFHWDFASFIQVVDIEPVAAEHDVRVDWIITPTRTVRVRGPLRPPGQVRWELIAGTELELIPPVRDLAARARRGLRGHRIIEEAPGNRDTR